MNEFHFPWPYPTLVEEATPNSQAIHLSAAAFYISRLRAIFGRLLLRLISGIESSAFFRNYYFPTQLTPLRPSTRERTLFAIIYYRQSKEPFSEPDISLLSALQFQNMDANMEDAAPAPQQQTEATDAQMAAAAAARGGGNGTMDRNANGAQANLNDEPGLDGYERYVQCNGIMCLVLARLYLQMILLCAAHLVLHFL